MGLTGFDSNKEKSESMELMELGTINCSKNIIAKNNNIIEVNFNRNVETTLQNVA